MNTEQLLLALIVILILPIPALPAGSNEVPRIPKEELQPILGSPEFIIIDVRQPKDWDSSDFKIRGALREDPNNIPEWQKNYSGEKTLVFYCA